LVVEVAAGSTEEQVFEAAQKIDGGNFTETSNGDWVIEAADALEGAEADDTDEPYTLLFFTDEDGLAA
jgi:hypothetical protein